jgi:CRISPR-associated protein Csx10
MLRRMLLGINLGDDMDRYKSLFAALTPVPAAYRSFEIRKRQIARTAIDSTRGTARPRRLYALEALEADQRFRGLIRGQTDLLARLRERVLIEDVSLSLGQGRSRGLGEAVLDRAERPTLQPDAGATMTEEVHSFNELLHKDYEHLYYAAGKIPYPYGDDLLLPVTLESDVLLRDSYLLPSTDPRPTVTLGRYLPVPPPLDTEMRLVEAGVVQSTHWIGGWDELRRLPRPPQLATAAGSVWTFRLAPALLDTALDWWDAAQRNGLGERRAEGFGRVRLCHPLHLTEGPQ